MNYQIEKLKKLKHKRNAVILAHYYQDPEIQDVADILGDSLLLAQKAKETDADVILFCGVYFMGETAKILNPDKTVLIPDINAGCSLADGTDPQIFKKWVEAHPNHAVISYVNCSAEIKAMSTVICTSANAGKIVSSIPENVPICFAPDKHLGAHVMKQTKREMVLWDGKCQVHEQFSMEALLQLKKQYSNALVLAHPECPEYILDHADYIGSTGGIIKHVTESLCQEFLVLTEPDIIHQLQKAAPKKKYHTIPSMNGTPYNICPYMKMNSIDKMINTLETLAPEIEIDEELRKKALKPLLKMLELSI